MNRMAVRVFGAVSCAGKLSDKGQNPMAAAHRLISTRPTAWLCALLVALFGTGLACAHDAATLRARHAALQEQLAHNQFQRPMVIESTQTDGDLKGDIFSVVDVPYAALKPALQGTDHW